MSSHWDRDIVIPVNPALANLLTEAEKQGEEMRQRALARLRKHKGPLAQPTCENCKYSNLAHPPEDHCYMFREKPKTYLSRYALADSGIIPYFPSG